MKKRKIYNKSLRRFKKIPRPVAWVALFAVIGVISLVLVRAAVTQSLFEPENGTLSGNVISGVDANAAGGKYVQFKAGSVTPPTGTSGKFYIVGKQIIAPDGSVFYPVGANITTTVHNDCARLQGGSGESGLGHSTEAQAWGWNTVRLNVYYTGVCSPGTSQDVLNGIDALINEYTAKKIVVIIDDHDIDLSGNGGIENANDARVNQANAFWQIIAPKYKNNPYVWYNLLNEFEHKDNTAVWYPVMVRLRDTVRASGAENITIADLPVWAQNLNTLADTSISDLATNQCNIMFGFHAYGGVGDTPAHETNIQKVQAKNLAVIVGEYGADPFNVYNNVDAIPDMDDRGVRAMQQLGPTYGIGLIWWHAIGGSNNTNFFPLKNDRSAYFVGGPQGASGLTTYGQRHWDIGHNKPVFTFSGSLSNSHCASAQ